MSEMIDDITPKTAAASAPDMMFLTETSSGAFRVKFKQNL
jgi:hypothetical protein